MTPGSSTQFLFVRDRVFCHVSDTALLGCVTDFEESVVVHTYISAISRSTTPKFTGPLQSRLLASHPIVAKHELQSNTGKVELDHQSRHLNCINSGSYLLVAIIRALQDFQLPIVVKQLLFESRSNLTDTGPTTPALHTSRRDPCCVPTNQFQC